MSGDLPTIAMRLDIETLRAIESAANAGRLAISEAAMLHIAQARLELDHNAPHGPRSILLAMAQTQAAAEFREALASASAPAPWALEMHRHPMELFDDSGDHVLSLEHLRPEQQRQLAPLIMLAVNTAAGFRAMEQDGALTWEIATR